MSIHHVISLSSDEDDFSSRPNKKHRSNDITSLHANLYLNSLAHEGTRSRVNCGCLTLRDIINGHIGIPDQVRYKGSYAFSINVLF